MLNRWAMIFKIMPDHLHICDWDTFYRSIELKSVRDQYWTTKYNTRLLPVGKNLKRRRHSQTAACPCCGKDEDHDHLIQCTHCEMSQTFEDLYDNIQQKLTQQAHPLIANDICFLLQYYRSPFHMRPPLPNEMSSSLSQQLILGQNAFLAGLWIHDWLKLQATRYSDHNSGRQAQRWITNLIHNI